MAVNAQTLKLLRAALAGVLGEVPDLKVYEKDPGPASLDKLPAIVLLPPDLERVQPEERESSIGSPDWTIMWPGFLYIDAQSPEYSQDAALELVAQLVAAVDADPQFADGVDDSKLVRAHADFAETKTEPVRKLIVYECWFGLIFRPDY